jgi:hypothetical protein
VKKVWNVELSQQQKRSRNGTKRKKLDGAFEGLQLDNDYFNDDEKKNRKTICEEFYFQEKKIERKNNVINEIKINLYGIRVKIKWKRYFEQSFVGFETGCGGFSGSEGTEIGFLLNNQLEIILTRRLQGMTHGFLEEDDDTLWKRSLNVVKKTRIFFFFEVCEYPLLQEESSNAGRTTKEWFFSR